MSEEEISMLLDTYMYFDYKEAKDGTSMRSILSELARAGNNREGSNHYGEYQVLSKAIAENPELGKMVIGNQSHLLGYDSGTAACTFTSADGESIFVVYRGTGDGEWPDNGKGMTAAVTRQQQRALDYFDQVIEQAQVTPEQRLIVTGHSKGGNKAQFVTMSTSHEELLDVCYSIDGQGFSEMAAAKWKQELGEGGYAARTAKITGVCGENDYVNVLGYSIIPGEQIHYIKTPVKKSNFAGYHDIKYMYASWQQDPKTGENVMVFNGSRNDFASERGELGNYAAALSASLMQLKPEKRKGCAAFLMQLLELGGEKKTGLNGEILKLSDIRDFRDAGIPVIAESLFLTGQGHLFLQAVFGEPVFARELKGRLFLQLSEEGLRRQIADLEELATRADQVEKELEAVTDELPLFMKNGLEYHLRMQLAEGELEREVKDLRKLAGKLVKVKDIYRRADEKARELLLAEIE